MLQELIILFLYFLLLSNTFIKAQDDALILSSKLNIFPQSSGSYSSLYFDSSSMKLYSFGGFDGSSSLDAIQSANISVSMKNINQQKQSSNDYTQISLDSVDSFSIIGKLPQKASGYAFHVLNLNGIDYAFVFGVMDDNLPYTYWNGVSFRTEKKIFLIGGSYNSEYSKAVYMANLNSPTVWQRVGTFPKTMFGASVFSIGRMIYIIGGTDFVNYYKTIYCTSFDQLDALSMSNASSSSVWKLSSNLFPVSVYGSASFVSANYAYMFSGSLGKSLFRASLSNMSNWENVTSFSPPYSAFGTSTLNVGNSVLLAGGGSYGYIITLNGYMNCFGVQINDATVCSGKGNCIGLNKCSCYSGFYGDACQYESVCDGIKASSKLVCSGNGMCKVGGNCSCFEGYSGVGCNDFACGGVSVLEKDKSLICSGHGSCISPGNCSCQLGFYGANCENFDCFGISSNDKQVCSGSGNCIAPDNCQCDGESGRVGPQCNLYQCYQKLSNDSLVCSGFGQCVGTDTCECLTGYSGTECNSYKCQANSFIPQCMGRGSCTKELKCSCQEGYYGDSCEYFNCWGISNTDSKACSGNGVCTNVDTCDCNKSESGYYYGNSCELYIDSSVKASLVIALNESSVSVDEGVVSFKIGSSIQSGLVSFKIWCSNCSDYKYNSYENSLIVESLEFSFDISSLKTDYSYEFMIQGVISDNSQDVLSNTLSTTLFIAKKVIQPQDVLISQLETSKLSSTRAFTKNFDISFLISSISFNYPEGVDFLMNDCVGYSLESNTSCQLSYFTTITVYNSSDFKTALTIIENGGSILAKRNRDIASLQLNPVLQMNISNPFPNMHIDAFDGSDLVFQISFVIMSMKYAFQSFEKSQISITITKPATYPKDYLNRIELSPKEGMAIVDSFYVSSPEWIVNNLNLQPLSYAFGFYNKFQDKSTNGIPSSSSLIRVTEYSTEPVSKMPLPYIFKSLSRNSFSTSPIEIVIFVKDAEGFEQSLRITTAQVNPLTVELTYLYDYSKYVLAFDQSALQNKNNTNLILNVISNVNLDISNADNSLKVLNSISSESSILKDKKVLNQLSNTVNTFLYNTLDVYQKEIDTYGYVKSSLTQDAKLSAVSLLANIFGSSSSSITISQKGMLLVDDEMQRTENLILSFTKLMLKSEIPKILNTDTEFTNLPYTRFSTSGLNTTFSSFVLTRGARRARNSTQSTKFLLETVGGNIQMDLREIAASYGGFGSNLGLSLVTYERNIRNDNFSMQNQMSSFIQELKYFQNAEIVKLNDLTNPIALQFVINSASRENLTLGPQIVSSESQILNETLETNGTDPILNITTTIVEELHISCLYWDEILMKWSGFGCSLDFYDNITGIAQCSCSHTTKFSTFLQYERRNVTSTEYFGGMPPKPSMKSPAPNDPSFMVNVQYVRMVLNFLFSLVSIGLLILLGIFRKHQPVQSRMITPFVGIIAILFESVLSILQEALFVYEIFDNSNNLMGVNITGNVCMVIVNSLNITAIFAYLIQVIRYQFMKALYEELKLNKNDSNRNIIRMLKVITSRYVFSFAVIVCLFLNVIVWCIFVIIIRLDLISPEIYIRTTSMTYAGVIVICSITIIITILIDIISAIRKKENSNTNGNSSRVLQFGEKKLEETNTPTSLERKNVIIRILQLDNPLYFRLEMFLFLLCFFSCLIQMLSGILSHEFKDSQDGIDQYFQILQLVFETIYSLIYLFVFGGFALVLLFRYKANKRSIANGDDLFEQSDLIETLLDQSGFELFEEYSKKEFSLENLYFFLELTQNKTIVMGENFSLLPMFMDRIKENFLESGAMYEVNIPSNTKNLFTELHFYVSSKRNALISYNQPLVSPISEPTSPENQPFNPLLIGNELYKQLESLSEEEEVILKARVVTCFNSLSQQIMINMNDTFYRFISTKSFKNYRKNKEMFMSMAKQTNIMAWQDDPYVV